MLSWQRTFYIFGLAVLEATLASLALTAIGLPAWRLMVGVVLAGALADWLAQRWLRAERQAPVLFGLGLLLGLWAVKARWSGDYGAISHWGTAWARLFTVGGQSASAYVLLFVTMYAFWRGTRLLNHDSGSLHRLFGRAIVGILVIIGLGGLLGAMAAAHVAQATAQVFVFFCVGLLTIALADAAESNDAHMRRVDWRGFATLVGAVLLVLLLGLLTAALFGDQAAVVARTSWQAIVLLVLLVMSPILLALGAIITWIMGMLPLAEAARLLQQQQQQQQQQQLRALHEATGIPNWLAVPTQIVCAVVPLLLLLALYVFMRRRRAHRANEDEQRESLLSWRGVMADVRELLGGLRAPFGGKTGLRAALDRLHGDDPAIRIRRSYIHLLLTGEKREMPRHATQTPREYEAPATSMLPRAAAAIARLTRAYERARYHPSGTTTADADAAEQALHEIERTSG